MGKNLERVVSEESSELKVVAPQFVKTVRLKSAGYDEKWLQDYLATHPEVLGFGDEVECRDKERLEPKGGRLDLLFANRESGIRYCVEVMLGDVDESHIIRTIEYWDHERSRYPNFEHIAVLVAEGITSRFLNVISLVARSIPLVVIQMSAIKVNNQLALTFATILDHIEKGVEEEGSGSWEKTTRQDWEGKAAPKSLEALDAWISLVRKVDPSPRVTYNRGHVAIGGANTSNFSWPGPRTNNDWVRIEIYVPPSERQKWESSLNRVGIQSFYAKSGSLRFNLMAAHIKENEELLRKMIEMSLRATE